MCTQVYESGGKSYVSSAGATASTMRLLSQSGESTTPASTATEVSSDRHHSSTQSNPAVAEFAGKGRTNGALIHFTFTAKRNLTALPSSVELDSDTETTPVLVISVWCINCLLLEVVLLLTRYVFQFVDRILYCIRFCHCGGIVIFIDLRNLTAKCWVIRSVGLNRTLRRLIIDNKMKYNAGKIYYSLLKFNKGVRSKLLLVCRPIARVSVARAWQTVRLA